MIKKSLLSVIVVTLFTGLLLSCNDIKQEKRLVIWTDNSELASYAEVYNKEHKDKAVIVFKEDLSASLPPLRDEILPDIILGTWLRTNKIKKNFESLDFLFERGYLSSENFYKALLDAGKLHYKQYLLPISFNLPAIIFSAENEDKVENAYTITLEQLKKAGTAFNKKNKQDSYTAIGFAPQSNKEFLYTVAKIKGADFHEERNENLAWNQEELNKTLSYLKDWITTSNSSPQIEKDFVYKYLSVADDKKVLLGKTLFAYMTSNNLFSFSKEQLSKIDFRWLEYNDQIPVEDTMNMIGISKTSQNKAQAADFISWIFKTETQKKLIDRKINQKLDSIKFGIAGGFSSVIEVNELVLPIYYTTLLSNIPDGSSFHVYSKKPSNWDKIKEKVIFPYIEETISAVPGKKVSTIEERYTELKKSSF